MVMLGSPSTKVAIILVGIKDQNGVYRFPTKNSFNPGIVFKVNHDLTINQQIMREVESVTGIDNISIAVDIEQNFSAKVQLPNQESATLYVGRIDFYDTPVNESWRPLPEILRDMPKTKNRAAYLKAWQVLMGGLSQEVKVVESDENWSRPETEKKDNNIH